jgi:hypothetical protein
VHDRQVGRNALTSLDNENKRIAEGLLANHQRPDWHKLEARTQAFAYEPVMTLLYASSNAHIKAMAAYNEVASTQAVAARPPLARVQDALDNVRIQQRKPTAA